jgi:hypothetical protein
VLKKYNLLGSIAVTLAATGKAGFFDEKGFFDG